jgi:hypothetical protein
MGDAYSPIRELNLLNEFCDRTDLATLPVVLIGDEGDLGITARNLLELCQLLTIDSETFDPDDVEEHSDGHEDYSSKTDG